MLDRIDHLTFLTVLVAGRRTDRFEDAVKLAYHAGASQEDLLTAAEIGRALANVPDPVVVQAYATIQAWHWITPGGVGHRPELAAQAA
jgi:hypothetical protein